MYENLAQEARMICPSSYPGVPACTNDDWWNWRENESETEENTLPETFYRNKKDFEPQGPTVLLPDLWWEYGYTKQGIVRKRRRLLFGF